MYTKKVSLHIYSLDQLIFIRRTELPLTTKLSAEHETPPIANVLLCPVVTTVDEFPGMRACGCATYEVHHKRQEFEALQCKAQSALSLLRQKFQTLRFFAHSFSHLQSPPHNNNLEHIPLLVINEINKRIGLQSTNNAGTIAAIRQYLICE